MLHSLTPHFILDELAAGRTAGKFDGVCVFVDIAGFTPLTLALMEHGTEGAEVLADVLMRVFGPLIEIVYDQGGWIAGFAGDAFKAVFPCHAASVGPDAPDTAYRHAVQAAWRIRTRLATAPHVETRFGTFGFSGKACVADGVVDWQIWQAGSIADTPDTWGVGQSQQAACVIGGTAMAAALSLDPQAERGEAIVSQAVLARLPADLLRTTPRAGCARIDDFLAPLLPPVTAALPHVTNASPDPELAARFFPAELLRSPLQGEFRRVTTVFVNFTRELTPAEQADFEATFFALLARFSGFLCRVGQIGGKDNGQTLLLFWGAPVSSEHDVARALNFLLALRAAAPVPLRAGVTTHLAYAGFVGAPRREEYTCYGTYVNLAARQLMAAEAGEIWLDAATARRAQDFTLAEHGQRQFKGFAAPQPVTLLAGSGLQTAARDYHRPLVGRGAELARLHQALEPLHAQQFGGVITLIGEAGMGKSRLAHELLHPTADEAPVPSGQPQSILCQTDEILRQPLNPFRYWLRTYFNQAPGQSEAANKAAFAAKLDQLNRQLTARLATAPPRSSMRALLAELDRTRPFLGALVDLHWAGSLYEQLEPQLRYENTLDALKTLLKAESLRHPLVIQLEDAHWLDQESAEFVAKLLHNIDDYPLLLLVTTRHVEAHSSEFDIAKALPTDISQSTVDLTALDPAAITAVAAELLGGPLAPSLAEELTRRADGNPFFAEQIVLYLREQQLLRQTGDGWQLDTTAGDGFTAHAVLSGDVRAILTARLDRLPGPVKAVVLAAAVLGREFDTRVLMHMLQANAELRLKLQAATEAALWSAVEETRYLFRHALLRDAAYDMQLRARLRDSAQPRGRSHPHHLCRRLAAPLRRPGLSLSAQRGVATRTALCRPGR